MLRKALVAIGFRCVDGAWHRGAKQGESIFAGGVLFPPWKEDALADAASPRVNLHPFRDA